MFGFGSSSSSPPPASTPTEAPNREQRKHCWESRDTYFSCLDRNGITLAGAVGAGVVEGEDKCRVEKGNYERHCGKSWIDYFNKRRILELRQKATLEAAARQRDENPANAGR